MVDDKGLQDDDDDDDDDEEVEVETLFAGTTSKSSAVGEAVAAVAAMGGTRLSVTMTST